MHLWSDVSLIEMSAKINEVLIIYSAFSWQKTAPALGKTEGWGMFQQDEEIYS